MHIFLEFIESAALILAVCFMQRFIVERWKYQEIQGQVLSGLLFGGAAVTVMSLAFEVAPGVFFDARTVVLSMGALFGGPVTAILSAAITGAYRLHLGGDGAITGLSVIVSASLTGLIFRHIYRNRLTEIHALALLGAGLVIHLISIGWFYFLPLDFVTIILGKLAVPYVAILTPATLTMGLLLREIEKVRLFDQILGESHSRFEILFASTSVALLEEDVTLTLTEMERIRQAGIDDLHDYLTQNPAEVDRLASTVRISGANPAALRLFGVDTLNELKTGIQTFFTAATRKTFIQELEAIWQGERWFQQEIEFKTKAGNIRQCVISVPLPTSPDSARHIPVSILDITGQKQAERDMLEERRRLQEVVWGTDAGTWEWNVQTGEVRFNDRWAEIIGYSLEELAPTSIGTWEALTHPDDLKDTGERIKEALARKPQTFEQEVRMRHKDGQWVWVLDRGKVVEWTEDGSPLRMSGTHLDITARKNAEERLKRLSDIRDVLLQCHATMHAATSEDTLFAETAKLLYKARGYALVWIGIPQDDADKTVKPAAIAGDETGYVEGLVIHWADDELGQGPSGKAIRSGEVQVTQDLAGSYAFQPWAAAAKAHALRSSAAVPVKAGNKVVAVVNIYSMDAEAFSDEEISLVTDFGRDLGTTLHNLRLRADRRRLHQELEGAAFNAVRALAATLEKRDPYTAGHQDKVADLAVAIGRKLGWDEFRLQGLRLGAIIHDIGKIYVPAEILNRPGKLTAGEFALIKEHPQVGYDILADVTFPWPIKEMIRQHHERIDGSGYPDGLKGSEILDEAKIIAVADVVEAITSHRPYRPGRGLDTALAEIERGRGAIYEPSIVDACLDLIRNDGYSI